MLKPLTRLSSELVIKNPWWEYVRDTYTQPNGEVGEYHYVHTPGSVMILPITTEGELLLIRQYRYLNRRESIELIGGGAKAGRTPAESAVDELREEAGIIASDLELLGSFNPMNGVTDEICNIFIARALKIVQAEPEATEELELVRLRYDELREMIREGIIWDGMTLAVLSLFEAHKHKFLLSEAA